MILIDRGTAAAKVEQLLVELPKDGSVDLPEFHGWHEKALTTLGTIYGDESLFVKRFSQILFVPTTVLDFTHRLYSDLPYLRVSTQNAHLARAYQAGCERAENMFQELLERLSVSTEPVSNPPAQHIKDLSLRNNMSTIAKTDALAKLQTALRTMPRGQNDKSEIFHDWHDRTIADVHAIFGDDKAKRFEKISFSLTSFRRIRGDDDASARMGRETAQAYQAGCNEADERLKELAAIVLGWPDDQEPKALGLMEMVRTQFEEVIGEKGSAVTIHKGYGTSQHSKHRIEKALKTQNDGDVFQFLEVVDIAQNDLIQEEGSTKLWRIMTTAKYIEGGVFVYFEAAVERYSGAPQSQAARSGHAINIGTLIGGLQLDSPNAVQNVSIAINPQVAAAVNTIRAAVDGSDELDEDAKADIKHELEHLSMIAKRQPTPKAIASLNEKLTTIEKMLSIATKLASIVGPAILVIQQYCQSHGH